MKVAVPQARNAELEHQSTERVPHNFDFFVRVLLNQVQLLLSFRFSNFSQIEAPSWWNNWGRFGLFRFTAHLKQAGKLINTTLGQSPKISMSYKTHFSAVLSNGAMLAKRAFLLMLLLIQTELYKFLAKLYNLLTQLYRYCTKYSTKMHMHFLKNAYASGFEMISKSVLCISSTLLEGGAASW
jgi:hypothetical protein